LKVCFRTGANILEQPIIKKPGMLRNVADLDDYSYFTDLKIFQTETGYKNVNNSDSSSTTGYRGKCT
jgi:hypothetical protein